MDTPLSSGERHFEQQKAYSVFEMLCVGSRFTDDFEPEDAVRKYLSLHPEAIEADVRAELQAWLTKRGMAWT